MYMHVDGHYYYLVATTRNWSIIYTTNLVACTILYIYRPKQWSNSGQLTHFHHTIVQTGSYPSLFWQSHVVHFFCRCMTNTKYTLTQNQIGHKVWPSNCMWLLSWKPSNTFLPESEEYQSVQLYSGNVLIVNIILLGTFAHHSWHVQTKEMFSTFSRDLSRSLTLFQLCAMKSQCTTKLMSQCEHVWQTSPHSIYWFMTCSLPWKIGIGIYL